MSWKFIRSIPSFLFLVSSCRLWVGELDDASFHELLRLVSSCRLLICVRKVLLSEVNYSFHALTK